MIYLLGFGSLSAYLVYCVASGPSIGAIGAAFVCTASGLASVYYRRHGLLGLSVASALILYFLTAFPAEGQVRIVETLMLGSSLFIYADVVHDLITLRIRRVTRASYALRTRVILGVVGVSVTASVAIIVLAASTERHLPALARIGFSVPALATLVGLFGGYLYLRSRER